jgi:hypothetical protein
MDIELGVCSFPLTAAFRKNIKPDISQIVKMLKNDDSGIQSSSVDALAMCTDNFVI